MKKIIYYAQAAAATALAYGPVAALAQTRRLQPADIPVGGEEITTGTLERLLTDVAQFLITASVIIAVIVIIYGGIVWMYKGSEDGKKILTKGIIGVAIVLGVGVILSTVARIVTQQVIT